MKKKKIFFPACESIFKAIQKYDPTKYGYNYAEKLAPRFNFGGEKNVRYAVSIKNIK